MNVEKIENRNLKFINISFGIIIILLSIIVLVFSVATIVILLLILALNLLVSGLATIYNAYIDKNLTKSEIMLKYMIGILAIIIALLILISIMINPAGSVLIVTILFGIILILIGLIGIYLGIKIRNFGKNYKIVLIVIGISTLIFGILVLVLPSLGFITLIILISLSLMLNGIFRLVSALL